MEVRVLTKIPLSVDSATQVVFVDDNKNGKLDEGEYVLGKQSNPLRDEFLPASLKEINQIIDRDGRLNLDLFGLTSFSFQLGLLGKNGKVYHAGLIDQSLDRPDTIPFTKQVYITREGDRLNLIHEWRLHGEGDAGTPEIPLKITRYFPSDNLALLEGLR